MTISLNLKNGAVAQNVSEDQNYSYIYHKYNDLKSELRVGVDSNGSYTNVISDKIYHNGNNITPYNFISNCITKIPQDIKLELNDGILTLKAGSKVYVPNGTDVFDVVTIASDLTMIYTWATAEQIVIAVNVLGTSLVRTGLNRCTSGTTAPTETDYRWWYDIDANLIKEYSDGAYAGNNVSLPIAIVTVPGDSTMTVTSIDQVFNGFGYIGSTVFALPGLKGLASNGRNTDRSLKNIEFITDSVTTVNASDDINYFGIKIDDKIRVEVYAENLYNKETNTVIFNDTVHKWMYAGTLSCSSGKITSFTPKTVFHALDYNDKETISSWRDINYSAKIQIANNYTITKRGYVWGYNTAGDVNFALYVNDIYLGGGYTNHGGRSSGYAIVSAGDVIKIGGSGPVAFFAPAKGE